MDYVVRPIGKTCEATGESLVPGDVCHSLLIERDGRIVRLDYSDAGWSGAPAGSIANWKTTVPDHHAAKPRALDPESLFHCFEQMCEDANPGQDKLRYVFALMLLQKRRLKIEGTRREDDTEYLELFGVQGEGPFEVRDYELDLNEIDELQMEFNGQLNTLAS